MTQDTQRRTDTHDRRAGWLGRLNKALHHYQARRRQRAALERLYSLDDALLEDLGFTRRDIEWAHRQPMDIDVADALRQRAAVRQAEEAYRHRHRMIRQSA